jgi:hypothetical protein
MGSRSNIWLRILLCLIIGIKIANAKEVYSTSVVLNGVEEGKIFHLYEGQRVIDAAYNFAFNYVEDIEGTGWNLTCTLPPHYFGTFSNNFN